MTAALLAFTVSAIFGDHAVLQSGKPVPIWGTAAPGERVAVQRGHNHPVSAVADAYGRWTVWLPPMTAACEPTELSVRTRSDRVVFHDLVVGEVWLCGGQSNMDFRLDRAADARREIEAARWPWIRQLRVERNPQQAPADTVRAQWTVCSPSNAAGFTAVGYYFARALWQELHVPVGIISSSYGNTPIEAWMPAHALELARAAGLALTTPEYPYQEPSVLYNGMIHPLMPCALRGFLWYQGESNTAHAAEYPSLFSALIRHWRHDFGQGELPFFWVQLPNLRSGFPAGTTGAQWAALRQAQHRVLDEVPAAGEVVSIDAGDPENIHPPDKRSVGERLARLALHDAYRRPIVAQGPVPIEASSVKGALRIRFDDRFGRPLLHGGHEVAGSFELAGSAGDYRTADSAQVDGDVLILRSREVAQPRGARYAWAADPKACLYNAAGLPAAPFQIAAPAAGSVK